MRATGFVGAAAVVLALSGAAVGVSAVGPAGPQVPRTAATSTTLPAGGTGLATGRFAPAVRGTAVQVTPTLPPPSVPDWATGTVPGCAPGSLIRSVDTGGRRMISFTFDDGPWPTNTRRIMDAFATRGLTATFFMIGQNLLEYPEIGRSVVERGFAVGNHSVSHRYRPSTIASEIGPMNELIWNVLGVRTPYFRSPGLTQGSVIQSTLAATGQCNLFTSVVLGDHLQPRRSASQLCSSFAASLRPGQIVLLHDGGSHAPTVAAVPCMLDVALSRGYEVVSLAELLAAGPIVPFTRLTTSAFSE
jgi:chitin deacetylase